VQVWHIVVLAFLTGIAGAVDAPARQAIIKDMVGHENITSGVALQSMTFNGARIIGPAAAGLMLAQFGPGWCFFVNGVSFLAVLVSLFLMDVHSALPAIGQTSPLTLLKEGIRFSRRHTHIWPLLLLSTITCIFLVNLVTILPAYADVVLHSPVDALSTLSTWQGIGAVVSALLMSYLSRRLGRGNVLLMTVVVMSISALGLAGATTLFPASLLIALFGFAMILFFIALNTTIQSQVPDQFRGRVLSLYTLTFMGLSPFGALAMGMIADRIGTPNALIVYAILNGVLSLAIFMRWPGVRHLA
jgi:MFS family permease